MRVLTTIILSCVALFATQTIEMSKKQQSDLGVKLQKVTSIDKIVFGPYSGVVVIDKKDILSIAANTKSIVKDIYVSKFQRVKKGEKLLTLSSNELLNLQKEYIQALINNENINETYERNIKLQKQGIISHKKLAISAKEKKTADLNLKLSANYLLASGLSNSMIKRIQDSHLPIMKITILSPRDGVIYNIDANVGGVVDSDRALISMYGDGDRFIDITLPVKNIENISLANICVFSTLSAKITMIGNVVDTNTQSVQVRAKIDNAKNIMINRIYDVKILQDTSGAVKIKKSALVYVEDNSYVFKKVEQGFEVISVDIISEGPSCYIVKADLSEGDELAVSSTSALLGGMESGDE